MAAPDPQDLDSIARVVGGESLDDAMREGANLLARWSGGHAAIFLADGLEPLREYWSAGPERPDAVRASFKRAALEAVRTGEPHEIVSGPDADRGRAVPLTAQTKTLGAVCIGSPHAGEDRDPTSVPALLAILAAKAAVHEEIARYRSQRERDERWFKTLDGHLRVLDRERQKLAALTNQTDAFLFTTDMDRIIRWTNRAMSDLFPPQDGGAWIGKSCALLCSQLGACGACPVARTGEEGAVVHSEVRANVGGTPGLLYLTALPIRGHSGRTEEIMVMLQDLTGLETLRKSEARYRLLFDRHANGILMVHPATYALLLANAAAGEILEYSREELLARTLADLHGEDWDRVRPRYESVAPDGSVPEIECSLTTRYGDERRARVSVSRQKLEGEDVLMVSLRDVTDQRRAERARERAEERLHTLVSGCPIVLFAIDRSGIFTLSEGQGLAALGLLPGQVVGQSVFTIYRDTPDILDHVRRALSGEEVLAEVEVGGTSFDVRSTPRPDADGVVQGIIGVATDVTRRKRAEEALRVREAELREAQKMEAVGVLAGGVAHDFNNLLTVILTQSELLLRALPRDGVGRRNAEEIHQAGARGAFLTRQLLTFSKSDVLALQVLDVNAVLDALRPGIRTLAGESVSLTYTREGAPLYVRADRGQIEQAVMSLVVNAIEAMEGGGTLRVGLSRLVLDEVRARERDLERPGGYAMLEVADTGCGMDAATRSRVFEPFFTTKGTGKGTGLGLSTLYGIAKRIGGSVTFRSEPGLGSTFTVHLPLLDHSESLERAPSESRTSHDLPMGTETVLLAEDEPGVRAVAKELLELQGYRVLEAANGIDALEIESRHVGPIDLLLTDVVMPRMGGRELAERFAARRPEARHLFVSGFTDDAALKDSVRSRDVAFLQKPYTLEGLAHAVRRVLDRATNTPLGHRDPTP